MENVNETTPAKRDFCVWADYVRRVYQHVEAESPRLAHELAKQNPHAWEPCEIHDTNGYRLSNEVQDLQTEEFVPIHGSKHCKTCGSEIVETVNDSNFREGECGPCEYRRYSSQPALLDAADLALTEIVQWDEVLGGSEDPRTKEAIEALDSAISRAYGKEA